MAHYAFLDENNIVTEVIVGRDETEGDWETYYGKLRGQRCVRTSYNSNIRVRFAGIGMIYDETLDAFLYQKPYESWILKPDTLEWDAPVASPVPPAGHTSEWDESNQTWVITPIE
jgi:hypothetical protein